MIERRISNIEYRKGRAFLIKVSLPILFSIFYSRSPIATVWADTSSVGTSGAEFLKIGAGTRPEGMGEAFTGVADDVDAIYWNPAGLGTLKSAEITGMHMDYFQNIQYEFAAFAYPTAEHGTFGFAVSNLHTDDINRRTDDTDAPIGQFGSSDNAYWLSYGYALTSKLSLGANAKFIHQTLDSINSNAYAGDGGILYDTDWHDLRLGASIQNLGSKVKFANEADPLPLTYRMGVSAPFLSRSLLISSDLIIPRDQQVGMAFGGEYKHDIGRGMVASMRSGYRTDSDVSGFSGVSVGGGIEVGRAAFDFAWVPFGDLGNAYRFGIHIKFGQPDDKNLHAAPSLKEAAVSSEPLNAGEPYAMPPPPKGLDTPERDDALEKLLSL